MSCMPSAVAVVAVVVRLGSSFKGMLRTQKKQKNTWNLLEDLTLLRSSPCLVLPRSPGLLGRGQQAAPVLRDLEMARRTRR